MMQVGEFRSIEGGYEFVLAHGLDQVAGRKDDVPAGVAAHDTREHLFVALIDGVTHAYAELAFECRNGVGADVARPVEHIQARSAVAAASGGAGDAHQEERSARHFSLRRSETTIRTPSPATIMVEMAFTTGFAPRRAIA